MVRTPVRFAKPTSCPVSLKISEGVISGSKIAFMIQACVRKVVILWWVGAVAGAEADVTKS